jgi:plastocyanin
VTRRSLALALAGALSFAACGDAGGGGESIEGQDVVVEMYDNRFQYTEIEIPVGGTVTWVGADRNPHKGQRAMVEFTLPDYGRYMFHPHQLWLADRGAMGWFAAI